jgi:stage II sporulation protein AA (anti-sigma F factor antagonist)
MSPQRLHGNWLEIEQIGDVSVAKFRTHRILSEEKLHAIGDQLAFLAEEAGHQRLVMNLNGVRRLSTEIVGKFMALQRLVKQKGGQLAFCNVHPELFQIFKICNLPHIIPFYETEQEALQNLESVIPA